MKTKLYLLLQDITTNKKFFKYFETEYEMDKFKRKLRFSNKLMLIEDSRELVFIDYDKWIIKYYISWNYNIIHRN